MTNDDDRSPTFDVPGPGFDPGHVPVLYREVLDSLSPEPGQTLLDCTAGLGGHAAAIGAKLGLGGRVVLFDLDPGNLERAEARVRAAMNPEDPAAARVDAVHANFAQAPVWCKRAGVRADMVLGDLGFASTQVDDPGRGLSFKRAGPLDMRMDPTGPITAGELVNTLPERDLAEIIFRYGEERLSRRIASKLVAERGVEPIKTTDRLAAIVRSVVPRKPGSIDGATRTFQALRIATNDEIGALEGLLGSIMRASERLGDEDCWLAPGSRVGIISFHSLEDRPVKRCFSALVQEGRAGAVSRGVITAGDDELGMNPRSRSAKLRVIRMGDGSMPGF